MSTNQLKVIGTGLGRTGTESLKKAFEQLGFGNCYHMFELMKHPEHLPGIVILLIKIWPNGCYQPLIKNQLDLALGIG